VVLSKPLRSTPFLFLERVPRRFDYHPLDSPVSCLFALYEELIIHIDREELARLLDIDLGFEVQNIEEDGKEFQFMLSRETDLSEKIPIREERRSFWLSRNSRENRTSFKGRPNISNGLARRGSDI
jgi:hypothetical protein